MQKPVAGLGALLFSALFMQSYAAADPIAVQGRLTGPAGAPLADAVTPVTFRVYLEAEGGLVQHVESHDLDLKSGLYSVTLDIPVGLVDGRALYISIEVNGEGVEMSPRIPVLPSPAAHFAWRAGNADMLDGRHAADFANHDHDHDGDYLRQDVGVIPGDLAVTGALKLGTATRCLAADAGTLRYNLGAVEVCDGDGNWQSLAAAAVAGPPGAIDNPGTSCSNLLDQGVTESGVYYLDPNGGSPNDAFRAYCDMTTDGGGWTLVMKLSASSFCYGSANWTNGAALNGGRLLDTTFPAAGEYDAKGEAFSSMGDVDELRFQTTRNQSVSVRFLTPSTPQTLITTNEVPFAEYPDYDAWRSTFAQDRARAPIFMRAGQAVTLGNSCRLSSAVPVGCGKLCTFCYQASDGTGCPDFTGSNDVNSGIGNDPAHCGASQANCSTAGQYASPNMRTLVWARRGVTNPAPGTRFAPGRSCKELKVGGVDASGVYWIDPEGGDTDDAFPVYCDMTTSGGGWTLVMKLSKNNFCYGSGNWTSSSPFQEAGTLSASLPGVAQYDAKNRAFYRMNDVSRLRFQTSRNSVETSFVSASSPRTLITTNSVAFAAYPDYTTWRVAFAQDRTQAPIFMRAGVAVTDGNTCRTNPGVTPAGCGKPCTFCYQASDGSGCPTAATQNDVNSGIGNNAASCGAGNSSTCSTGGNWADNNLRTIIWAK